MSLISVVLLLLLVIVGAAAVAAIAWFHDRHERLMRGHLELSAKHEALSNDYRTIEDRYRPALQQLEQQVRSLTSENSTVKERYNQAAQAYHQIKQQHTSLLENVRQRYGKIVDLDQEELRLGQQIKQLKGEFQSRVTALSNQFDAEHRRLQEEFDRHRADSAASIEALVRQRDSEANRLQADMARAYSDYERYVADIAGHRSAAGADYERVKTVYDRLKHEVAQLEGSLEDISYGLYKPNYDFDTSERFRMELDRVRDQKKQMVRLGQAARCLVEWTVGGSRKDGERMQKQLEKLMLRAFNGETDAAIGNVRWNNVTRMEERLRRAYEAVNKLGTVVQVAIVPEYLELAINEIRLEYEHEEKRHAEAEEQRQIKERMREEERAQRELRRAEQDAIADENRYQKALDKVRQEVARAQGAELTELNVRIAELEAELAEAHARHERAVSMAELTRCGYVYITSNMGSFGMDVYKIGMTRRLDPMDRIWELSDASVPFDFDVHGMIYSEDAPSLECALHTYFTERRVNLVNVRKEFFTISIDDIQEFLGSKGLKVELTKLAEAREYRESAAIRAKRKEPSVAILEPVECFPDQLE